MASPNRCKASFGSNLAIALATLEGHVVVASRSGSRDVTIESLYKENGDLNIASDEILTSIKIPVNKRRTNVFLQYKANPASYTVLNICASLVREDDKKTCKNIRVWLGGAAPRPYRAKEVEEYLKGKKLNKEIIEESSRLLFESLDVPEPVMIFKVAKARVLCREAITRAFEGAS
jgi:CO/xanthine dehydrogenase FAD-binding subunit